MRRLAVVLLAGALFACTSGGDGSTTSTAAPTTSTPSTTEPAPTTTTTPGPEPTIPELQGLAYEKVADLAFPVQVVARPGEMLLFVVLKGGVVLVLDLSTGEFRDEPYLDISDRVRNSGEQGFLAMALHPTDPSRVFVHYSGRDGRTVVSEFTQIAPDAADPGSERIIFEHPQPAPNHNGGMIQFTPDGTLLLGLGDGGGANDQFGNGQDPDTLLGGLVELDVDGDFEPRLYAMGLRNPWRFWIDEGLIYIADVGQNQYEEVNVAPLEPGHNFGWSEWEGLHCFRSETCSEEGFVMPVLEVSHGDAGTCSITGGVVYRGEQIFEFDGHYFYSDYCGSYLRSFRYQDGEVVDATDWTDQVGRTDGGVSGFGMDGIGQMYVTSANALYRVIGVRGG